MKQFRSTPIYIYVCVGVYVCIYIYICYTKTHAHIYIYIYTYIHTYTHAHTYTHTHTHTHTYIRRVSFSRVSPIVGFNPCLALAGFGPHTLATLSPKPASFVPPQPENAKL